MIERENPKLPTKISDPAVQFWVKQAPQTPRGKEHWLNVATRSPQVETPILGRGGILADGMGLGVYDVCAANDRQNPHSPCARTCHQV